MINIFLFKVCPFAAPSHPPVSVLVDFFYLGPLLTLTLFPLLFCSETSEDSCLLVNLWGNNGTCHCWFAMGGSAVKWCVPIFNKARYMYFVLTWYIQMSHNVHNVLFSTCWQSYAWCHWSLSEIFLTSRSRGLGWGQSWSSRKHLETKCTKTFKEKKTPGNKMYKNFSRVEKTWKLVPE